MNDNNRANIENEEINSGEYWDRRFGSGDWEEKQGREQSLFFYRLAADNFPEWFTRDICENHLSVCDLGCAEGEGVQLFGERLAGAEVTGCDISEAALERARQHYPGHRFVRETVNEFQSEFDVIFSSNTFEHFNNADELMKKVIKKCRKYFALLLPFKEYDRIDEHFFTFDYGKFPVCIEGYTAVFFKELDCTDMENTQWPGKEFLIIYQKNGSEGFSLRTLSETGCGIDGRLSEAEDGLKKKTELSRKIADELEKKERELFRQSEKIEEDRNAIMQIQFEAAQHKQAELDARETYVWRTGLRIEKLLQKTGIAFIRSLLVLSDYKRMGMILTLRKGINELFNRENISHSKKRRLEMCGKKFLRYKKDRESIAENSLSGFDAECEKGLVSVVLPVYNGEKVVSQSIESVLNQSFKRLELIVVNDGSTDKTREIAEEYARKDSRVIILNQENKKLPTALSNGFRLARGEFFTWTSADNIMLPDCISTLVSNLERKPEAAMVYGNMRLIDKNGKIKRGHFWFEKPFFSGNVCFPKTAERINTYANNTIGAAFMYRAKCAYILGDYSKYKTNLEDYDYWMRMNSLFKIEHTDEEKPLYLYRIHDESLTAHDRELGITKNRYKLMVLDDFRRDFYMSSLAWIADTENEESAAYKAFREKAERAGHIFLTAEEAEEFCIAEKYSCVCYIYFGDSLSREKTEKMKRYSGTVLVSESGKCENADMFDFCISLSEDERKDESCRRDIFYVSDTDAVFDIADSKLKNDILYGLEKMIDEPEECSKKISIIICTYMRGEKLIDAIWSVIRQSMSKKEYEIIIVDNAPQSSGIKGEIEYFRKKYREFEGYIRYIGVPQKGLSYARNCGMWNAKGEYLLFLDDDILADYYLLEEIFTAFKYHKDMGVVGGQVILDIPFPKPKILRKGWESLWSQFKISENSFREVTQQFEFPYGANYGVRRSAIWRAGGFRMCYGRVGNDFAGGEETALAFKMLQIGYGIGLQPKAKVLHRVDTQRFNKEHVRRTILAGVVTTYRFFIDLHTSVGWTRRYVREQIRITQKEINILKRKKADYLDIFYKMCYNEAWKTLLEYMKEN